MPVRKRIKKYNIAKTLGVTTQEWNMLKKRGMTPPADGQTWGGSYLEDFWYEDTLITWWEGLGRRAEPREYQKHRGRDIHGKNLQ